MTSPGLQPLDPLPRYRFIVTLDPGDAYLPPAQAALLPMVAAGAFQEVTGLYQAGLAGSLGARRDGAVVLLGPDGQPGAAWAFHGGLAAKWTGPDLHAEQSAVAIESLEIAHEGLTNVGPGAAGAQPNGLR
ncbi:MAG: hypothetical protein AUI14_21550 [Actinobacteria bacterium 13_2_20CM_2_71_6]|nr:MAG: hypothetical protein AUI14_21550 [Actinobacteria bacterium 13_2_20CM_2_71_6]